MGLSKAAIYEAVNRCAEMGAERAIVISDMEFSKQAKNENENKNCWSKHRKGVSFPKKLLVFVCHSKSGFYLLEYPKPLTKLVFRVSLLIVSPSYQRC